MPTTHRTQHEDLRIVKTKAAIREAFSSLLKRMDYSKITVTAIAKEARINRKTFYAHYASVEELLEAIARDEIAALCKAAVAEAGPRNAKMFMERLIYLITEKLDQYSDSENSIARSAPSGSLISLYREPLQECIVEEYGLYDLKSNPMFACSITYLIGGIINTFVNWRQGNLGDITREELAKTLSHIANKNVPVDSDAVGTVSTSA